MAGRSRLAWGLMAWFAMAAPAAGGCGDDSETTATCDPLQCPGEDTACSFRICDDAGACALDTPKATTCAFSGGSLCDGDGACVQCLEDEDCSGNVGCNDFGQCGTANCQDGKSNGNESDIDCGGQCGPCLNGQQCNMPDDCASGVCNDTCSPCLNTNECADGFICDNSTGNCIDEGSNGQPCTDPTDCNSGFCTDGFCCNEACDGTCESCGIDGDVGACTPHAGSTDPEMECIATDTCNGVGNCRCSDNVTSVGETDLDCGGPNCPACVNGDTCDTGSDCQSGACDANNICVDPDCMDITQNGMETDVDCGGPSCTPCADNLACLTPPDCQSGVCTGNVCQAATCSDTVANGVETDVDCGGGVCGPCADTQACLQPSDCMSGICTGNVCVAPSCSDMAQNGQETAVDCGGPMCTACIAGQGCALPSDCVSGICNGNVCACSPALNVLDDNSGMNGATGLPDLVMSEISPGNYIELFNTTGVAINLAAGNHWLCSPFDYAKVGTVAPATTVPAGGYATIPWPMNFTDVVAGGEVILYASSAFGTNTEILDFTCWGINPHGTRKTQAESVGKWSGPCNAALGSGAIHRNTSTTGIGSGDYDTTMGQTPMDCTP